MTYFLDLFSGIGGFRLGAECAGLRFDGHYYSEVDPYAIKVYSLRFPDAIALGDIRGIRGADLPVGDWIIAGGFPCQDISVAGKGAGLSGARSGLWYQYARIIGELRPRYAIMENVGALAFRGLDSVLGSLAALGYDAEWQDIRASDVGAPHRRERIWIVAYPGSKRWDTTREGEVCSEWKGKAFPPRKQCNNRADNLRILREWYTDSKIPGDVGSDARISDIMDRLKCLGNSIIPQIAELIFAQSAFDDWRRV